VVKRRARKGSTDSSTNYDPLAFVTGPLLRSIGALSPKTIVPGGVRDEAPRRLGRLVVPRFYFDDGRDRTVRLPAALSYGHRVAVLEMCLALSGSPLLVVEGQVYRLWDERLAILPPGVRHYDSCGHRARPYELVWIIVGPREGSMHITDYTPRDGYAIRVRTVLGPVGDAAERIAAEAQTAARGTSNLDRLKVALTAFTARASQFVAGGGTSNASSLPAAIERARAFIRARFAERISVADVAEAAHLSPNYLSSVFKEATGQTVLDEIHRLRLDEARSRLAESDDSIKEIAMALGFESQHYFSRFFRRATGMTPSEYRS
jgi:AraC-like DNA-binding protein